MPTDRKRRATDAEPFRPRLTEEDDPRLVKALELNAQVIAARVASERASEAAKMKKDIYKTLSEDLSDYLRSLSEELPLFDGREEEATRREGGGA